MCFTPAPSISSGGAHICLSAQRQAFLAPNGKDAAAAKFEIRQMIVFSRLFEAETAS
jgi:hypothetical protein